MRRNTIQRSIVKAAVAQLDHPSTEAVYQKVTQEFPDIGLSTVYRNINILEEDGMLRRLAIPGSADRFDGNMTPHDHFVCRRCNRVIDIEDVAPGANIKREIMGHQVEDYSIMLYGICRACADEHEKEQQHG